MKDSLKNLECVPEYTSQDPGATHLQDESFEECLDNCLRSAEDVVETTKTTLYDPDDRSLVGRLPSEKMEEIRSWNTRCSNEALDLKINIDAKSNKTESSGDSMVKVTSHGDLSEAESVDDLRPDLESDFSESVMSDIIKEYRKEVHIDIRDERYNKALESQQKAIEYLEEREKKYKIVYEDRVEMKEILADIYVKLNKPKDARNILVCLLKQEESNSECFNRLCHNLATFYLDQKDLVNAERYAKRAFNAREQKRDPRLNQSISLLVRVYEQQGNNAMASAFRRRLSEELAVHEPIVSSYGVNTIQESEEGIPWLKRNGFDLRVPDASKQEAMRFAVTKGQSEAVQAILDRMRNHDEKRNLAIEAFHWAVSANNLAITRLLLNMNDVSIPINALKPHKTALISAISSGHHEMVQLLLQMRADTETRCLEETTPLMHAVHSRNEITVSLLLTREANVDATSSGWTALHAAADKGDYEMVKTLIANDANIEARSPRTFRKGPSLAPNGSPPAAQVGDVDTSWTALLRAADRGDEVMVKLLLEQGAKIDAKNSIQLTPLMCASEAKHESVVKLLLEWRADVKARNKYGWTALHRAQITKGGVRVAELLLDHGADVEATCLKSQTALHHAAERGNDSMVTFLTKRNANIEARDIAERTPLHTAIEHRKKAVVEILIRHGADITARDKSGHDALAAANSTSHRSPEIIDLLRNEKKRRGSTSSNSSQLSRPATFDTTSTSAHSSSSHRWLFRSSGSRKSG